MRERSYFVIEKIGEGRKTAPEDKNGSLGSFGPVSSFGAVSARSSGFRLRSESMTEAQAADRRRDDKVQQVGEAMPLALIRPVADAPPAAAAAAMGEAGGADASWGIAASGADTSPCSGDGVTVAVLDTGIDREHPAFSGISERIETRDFTSDAPGAPDTDGHGTHCAGTIFGQDVAGTRIGIARGIERALIAKVIPDRGNSETTALFDAMLWAQREGANIISMSLGFDYPGMVKQLIERYDLPPAIAASQALVAFAANLRAFDSLVAAMRAQAAFGGGALIVAAAGNESLRARNADHVVSASLPSSAAGIVPVGAYARTASGFAVAPFSNSDPLICAPGVDIVSAEAGTSGLTAMSGTSMACPHIAGLAALWWQRLGDTERRVDADKVRDQLLVNYSRDGLPEPYDEASFGRGRAQAPRPDAVGMSSGSDIKAR